jgi:hypothetical protein
MMEEMEPQPQVEPHDQVYTQAQPQPDDDDVFFGDAPEQRTKNPRYN